MKYKKIVVLTGAGISAESGLNTFRDMNGLWNNHSIEDVASLKGFSQNPHLVWKFYSMRRREAGSAIPNAAHHAITASLATLSDRGSSCLLITQNVDTLHERCQNKNMRFGNFGDPKCIAFCALHGSLNASDCVKFGAVFTDRNSYFDDDGNADVKNIEGLFQSEKYPELGINLVATSDGLPLSPCCNSLLRPHIVWFGETPFGVRECGRALYGCDLFVSIGTSGTVYPASNFVSYARDGRALTVCINPEPPANASHFQMHIHGKATEAVPNFFEKFAF